jgi:hypothetical protein
MEPATAIGTGLAILGSKEVLTKLLGPTADYLGTEARGLVEKCNINLDNIFQKAVRKLGSRIGDSGTVSPRVLRHVVDEGRFCDDELVAEYYGGVLASARTPNGRDDRAVGLLALIKGLSVYQLRLHCLSYTLMRQLLLGQSLNLGDQHDCLKMRVFVPTEVFKKAMDLSPEEDIATIMIHSMFGLKRQELLKDFLSGDLEYMQQRFPNMRITEPGLVVTPSLPGAELFLWASGVSGASGIELLRDGIAIEPGKIEIPEGAFAFMHRNQEPQGGG